MDGWESGHGVLVVWGWNMGHSVGWGKNGLLVGGWRGTGTAPTTARATTTATANAIGDTCPHEINAIVVGRIHSAGVAWFTISLRILFVAHADIKDKLKGYRIQKFSSYLQSKLRWKFRLF
jgi:hypothetical protein